MVLLLIISFLFIAYSLLVLYYAWCWNKIPVFKPGHKIAGIKISVIIPARNEENNISSLLTALEQQTYPREWTEVIVVDDHSEDNTAGVVNRFPFVKLIRLKEGLINSYKKKAIETGINSASGNWIVCTDADCVPCNNWLQTIAAFKEEQETVFIVAPVVIQCNSSLLQIFQAMDFMVLQAITGAAVRQNKLSMCNGANLAYEKKAFLAVNGFAGIDSIASGDDMLLMYKIAKQNPGAVHYLKSNEAMVATQPALSWGAFFNQRIRWASKARQYQDKRFFPVLLLVYLFNLSFLVLIVAGFFNHTYWLWLAGLWVAKTLVELPLFASAASFFDKGWAVKWFFFFQPLHIFYTIISGFFGQMGKYEWKGRKVR